tara:strand:- start:235 stop:591 length:357 start_codon:yes stop_codon:yes gene_type:complete
MSTHYVTLNDTQARNRGMNPLWKYNIEPLVFFGQVIIEGEKGWEMPICTICDVKDENVDNSPSYSNEIIYTNGNLLIEYPKKSKTFYCPCCFQINMSDKVVERVLGEEWVMTPEERDY